MMQHHNYSLSDLENMIPWEREIYQKMLIQHLEEEKERRRKGDTKKRRETEKGGEEEKKR